MKDTALSGPVTHGMAMLFAKREGFSKLPGEPPKYYDFFLTYCDLGPERTIPLLVKTVGASLHPVARMARKWKWKARVEAYDDWLGNLRQQAVLEAIEQVTKKHAAKETVIKEREWTLAEALFGKVEQMLKVPVLKQSKREVTNRREDKDAEGRTVSIQEFITETTLKPANWSLNTVGELASIVSKLMRMSAGVPVAKLDVTAHIDPEALRSIAMKEEDARELEEAYLNTLRQRVESGEAEIRVLKPGEKLGTQAGGV